MSTSLEGLTYSEVCERVQDVIQRLRQRSSLSQARVHASIWDVHQPASDESGACRGCSHNWPCSTVVTLADWHSVM